jgi:hypothetical protein
MSHRGDLAEVLAHSQPPNYHSSGTGSATAVEYLAIRRSGVAYRAGLLKATGSPSEAHASSGSKRLAATGDLRG